MSEINQVQAINLALARAMADDPSVVIFGEDVGIDGGVFRATDGLLKRFGEERVRDTPIAVTLCRQECGAAMMADAWGRLTGKPGIVMATRGPGGTNATAGLHIGRQDSTPMILFLGQVARHMRGREAFQELNVRSFFAEVAAAIKTAFVGNGFYAFRCCVSKTGKFGKQKGSLDPT